MGNERPAAHGERRDGTDDGPDVAPGPAAPAGTAPDPSPSPAAPVAPGPATGAGPATEPRSTATEPGGGAYPADGVDGGPGERPGGGGAGRYGQPGQPLRLSPFLVGLTGGLGVLLAYTIFLAVRNAGSVLVLVFIALFLAIGLHPAVVRLRSWGLPRGVAVTAVTLTLLAVITGAVYALVPPVVSQTGELIGQVPDYVTELRRNDAVNDLIVQYDLAGRIESAATTENITRALGGVFGAAGFIFGAVFNVVTVIVLTIYFMATFDRLRDLGYGLVPATRRDRVRLIGDEILAKVGAYMVGALAIALLAGVSTFVFAIVVGLAYPFALAVVVAICDLIPQIGATIGAVVISLVGFATDVPTGIACVVFFLIYQQLENYLVYPRVMRRSVQVNDVAAIVAALLGVALFGVIGALVAIPAVAAIQLVLREVVLPRQQHR
ncbi:AI-2E family transporter [Plantactinospora mayteni]|uniref:AI-2E family transporter n=1 Tax=Plantactinospora mayteni TaxID=566021 RepID=A0ABQ4EMG6_9ACTN|nr:AI-2E family transporter [Plantactinospora mayteni]GIG95834.1 AI-2E family transporter [Plantactinospora mayteni]